MSGRDKEHGGEAYTYGESSLAARRLRLLSEIFAQTSWAFLVEAVDFPPRLALDLGCGPGFTTHLIADTLKPKETVGIERSANFLSYAQTTTRPGLSFMEGDVTQLPIPPNQADLIFSRFLLAHLSQPEILVGEWMRHLRLGGLLLLEEVESICTQHPVFLSYLRMLTAMMANNGSQLYVGSRLAAIGQDDSKQVQVNRVAELQPTTGQAAQMFSMNLANWREDDFVQATYPREQIDHVETELSRLTASQSRGEIVWMLRQIALSAK
jgi:ubiquinone/menaquinone biosynthesis C-methylase UbiE